MFVSWNDTLSLGMSIYIGSWGDRPGKFTGRQMDSEGNKQISRSLVCNIRLTILSHLFYYQSSIPQIAPRAETVVRGTLTMTTGIHSRALHPYTRLPQHKV